MATLSELVKAIAQIQGLEENQVLWIARYLREDGLIAQGGRGRGGAKMRVGDAANLLIGVNAPGAAKQSCQLVRSFRALPLTRDFLSLEDPEEWDELRSENDNDWNKSFYRLAPFGDTLEQIINKFRNEGDQLDRHTTRITLSGPELTASIYMGAEEAERARDMFVNVSFGPNIVCDDSKEVPDQEISKTFTDRTLARVGEALKS
ncbi:hypothetical protein FV242_12190 [Methylobacterium sp. WL64]|uniref:hypothetical protein n=1 Tax=Methylobacterium sp. WL64 TaxID=2603894 RepID=UPI0011C7AC2E|nr:hypothetical protein [Methylobacterium sp. WL64]TXN03238.1 hypothetical protein FV242_12190 [Methylobacterium sp. WL64]